MNEIPAEFYVAAAGLLGLLVGSFLNVVIYRLPVMMQRDWECECRALLAEAGNSDGDSADTVTGLAAKQTDGPVKDAEAEPFNLMVPRSRCGNCGTQITALQNIPVISWLFLRGKCAACGTKISARYPIIEAVTGVLSMLAVIQLGPSWSAVAALGFIWCLIALTMIDYDTQLLPDSITLPLVWAGIVVSMFPDESGLLAPDLQSSVIGAIAGYLSLWTVYQVFKKLTGKEGMGYGDFKLLAAIGAWLGWEMLPMVILLSAVVGSVTGIAMILFGGHDRQAPIPFGPYLAGAGLLALLWGNELGALMLRIFG